MCVRQPQFSAIHVALLGQPIKHHAVCVDRWDQAPCNRTTDLLRSSVTMATSDASMDYHIVIKGIWLSTLLLNAAEPSLCP